MINVFKKLVKENKRKIIKFFNLTYDYNSSIIITNTKKGANA